MTTDATQRHTDIPTGDWIDRLAPKPMQPYLRLMRLDRPIGTWLLLFPCWWSISMAASPFDEPLKALWFFALFGVGAVLMRGAGCVVNDLADRDIDGKVERTIGRPLPSGQVSPAQALAFLAFLLAVGLVILLQFNTFAVTVGAASLILVFIYPFAKRFTYWPQAVLGLTFNWGALLGWAAVTGELSLAPLLLYFGGWFWTMGYDTVYAHQDIEDDIIVGVKSSAIALGDATPKWLWVFYGAAITLFGIAGTLAGLSVWFYIGLAAAACHFIWQAATVDIKNQQDCLTKFKSNRYFGALMLIAVLLGQVG